MAGPYASITTPYAPGPGHINDAFRIADLIGQQGQSAAHAKLAKGLMVGNLVGDIGGTVGGIFARRDQARADEQEAQFLAELLASGKPVDLAALIQKLGPERAKALYPMIEGEFTKRQARAEADEKKRADANAVGMRQRVVGALNQGADPIAVTREFFGETGTMLPAGLVPDPKVAAAARDAANTRGMQQRAAAALNQGASPQAVNREFFGETGAALPAGVLPPVEKPDTPTEASLALRAAGGDKLAAAALERMRQFRAPHAGTAAPGPLVPVVGPDGTVTYGTREQAIGTPVPAGSEKPSSGQQKRVLNFFNRAQQADQDLEALEPQIQQMGLAGQAYQALMPNFLQTQLGQSYQAAQRAFTEARLRKDSGAAIPAEEFESDRKTYFAQPGDSALTLEQKRRARAAMLASLAFESGQALGEYVGDPDEAKAIVDRYKTRSASTTTPPAAAAADEAREVAAALKGTDPKTGKPFAPGIHTLEDEQGRKTKWRLMPNGSAFRMN